METLHRKVELYRILPRVRGVLCRGGERSQSREYMQPTCSVKIYLGAFVAPSLRAAFGGNKDVAHRGHGCEIGSVLAFMPRSEDAMRELLYKCITVDTLN